MDTRRAVIFLLAAVTLSVAEDKDCRSEKCIDFAMLRFYEELTCHPQNDTDSCCPNSFDCSFLDSVDEKKCLYKGIVYEKGTVITDEIDDPCFAECRCTETLGGTAFACSAVVCPEAEVYGQLLPNCFLKFDALHCCATGFYCLPDGNGEESVIQPARKCIYKGFEHVEGQYLSVGHHLCLTCVCGDGYDGTLNGPWCQRYPCDVLVQLKASQLRDCAPVFPDEFSCCPQTVHCPTGKDYVLQLPSNSRPETEPAADELACSFGNLRARPGEHVVSPGICVRCKCDVPPFITCRSYHYDGCKFPDPDMYGGR